MNRAQQKARTRERILGAAVRGLREMGLEGAGVNAVMKAAGLTHGGFYAHFDSRDDLVVQAMAEATRQQRQLWVSGIDETPAEQRVAHLAARYLSPTHRDRPQPAVVAAPAPADAPRANSRPDGGGGWIFGASRRSSGERSSFEHGGALGLRSHGLSGSAGARPATAWRRPCGG